uniref:protein phosphatase 1 regulatory subunit 15B n=1 Tax=Doryrhamphus excisus TaxID=161450 RepID=UPI0025AD9F2C|nr:protein phosphatase 1 regulatory subunit 15B [Doryrhamphus excisus]
MATLATQPRTTTTTITTTLESFGCRGMAILPWTKQLLTVLWEQLWLLVHVIYCSFLSVFQMFRFEVHLRITDQMGQHIQHSPAESFLFSSLFDGDGDEDGKTTAETLLSSLATDDLCCGLAPDEGVYVGFRSDWNIFVSGSTASNEDKFFTGAFPKESIFQQDTSENESGDDDIMDSKESDEPWESLSTCKDPYNPVFVSTCLSSNVTKSLNEPGDDASRGKTAEEMSGLKMWVSRSDSDSSWSSWSSSDVSGGDLEESERLLEFFASPDDPYNPMCFTACTISKAPPPPVSVSATSPAFKPDSEEGESCLVSSSEDEEEPVKALNRKDDPYHPLNFQAPLNKPKPAKSKQAPGAIPIMARNHRKFQWRVRQHDGIVRVPWKRHTHKHPSTPEKHNNTQKKLDFSPVVEVHVMRTWAFAMQASRKGPWEEMARDRERFRRRIDETERTIGHCFNPAHRDRLRAYVDAASSASQ